jgi:sterol desaturase/sphingolipid hydroxylase (fatty acid hydroxylase superfamily)
MIFEDEKQQYVYEKLYAYDIELTKLRWAVFTALFSVSLIIAGLALKRDPGTQTFELWAKYAIAFGFLVYLTAAFHYWWHHRISHHIRKELKVIEEKTNIKIIRIRKRPSKLHFHWMIWILGLAYAFLTYKIVEVHFFLWFIGALIVALVFFAVLYRFLPDEPFEEDKKRKKDTPAKNQGK